MDTRRRVGVEGVDAVGLRGYEDHVVRCRADQEISHVERLGVELAIHRAREELREARRIYIRSRQRVLLQVLTRARSVIVMHEHALDIADGESNGSGCGSVGYAHRSDGMHAWLCPGGEQADGADGACCGVPAGAAIDLPSYASVVRIVVDSGCELLRLRRCD